MRIARIVAAAVAASVAAAAVGATPAWAHNSLTSASPKPDATVTSVPSTVKLTFLQSLNPEFTTIVVSDAAKHPVTSEKPAVDSNVGTLALPPDMADGVYTVAYRVVSKDGHPVQGSYSFTLRNATTPTSAPAAPSSGATPSPSASASAATFVAPVAAADSGSGTAGWWVALVAVLVLLVGGMAVWVVRRKRAR
ncbi:copper resistance CopC family protein [Mangrovihabitans endophyticus]|uniref:CopC domain-containing protein n=1 Tax=Mangrovihabitans endophyticus TaxID=1751298 RepID=A0A8J3CAC1_9ACTN|nr:copper resistance CopC family protein [Mangrovihabitans endophyticus]GGL21209.1 hypothetical protein GCM10012284_64860 [Mangrovihabitans endophyticus]